MTYLSKFERKRWFFCWISLHIYNEAIRTFTISFPFSKLNKFLLGEVIISSKTGPHNGNKKEKRNYSKVKNNKTMLKILPFIAIIYLKQQSSILWCFCRLKFEKILFNNTFSSFIFGSKMIVYTIEKDQITYFSRN